MKMGLYNYLAGLAFVLLAPVIGGLLSGVDRILTARMQGRVGPPLLQPFYDVFKLFQKETTVVNRFQNFYIFCFVVFVVFAGALLFAGGDLLLVIFALTVGGVFFVLGGFATNSPYSFIGASRELVQMFAYEPMVILVAVGFYMAAGTFSAQELAFAKEPLIKWLPGVFIGFFAILTIKFRKSPFDLSMSHHAHQEIVRGITTEFSGKTLGWIEVAHWYENVFLLGLVYLFFSFNPWIGVGAALLTYFAEIWIDNTASRVKWEFTFKYAWIAAAVFGVGNILVLSWPKYKPLFDQLFGGK